ncbi:MAG: AAA family ATPase [Furfurilactobacillus sp.]|jgi:phage nucleotide-binding protein|uniref:AAA family ATPase n=1 Tax=Furfurilactobacillus sp. TaxID=2767911 RepID=UPI00258F7DE5|nr:AAA family ATPase [Furfurilactobacillus sp.]MCH4010566.1 AAA family ATPase [Furfurilactobacillus sp.]MCH4036458.1 AAA family ATPase [Furfurilactobacillus sp.]MCH4114596.1 AAA family ATPase [Furfurilactobacillus sp.]MCH4133785.1 AAA family ATPase [Furfurilactobacillus sp.]MCI1340178.1 AAA family ATPase [Furfurilactobacillus sp.]
MITQSTSNILKDSNWKMILYAKAGQGKTTSIQYLPGKTLLLDLDNSSKVLSGIPNIELYKFDNGTKEGRPFDREHPIEDMNTFLSDPDLKEISKKFNNVVIDNVSSLEKDWFVEMGRKSHNGISNEIQDYSQWTNYFARIVTTLYMIPNVNILITAWEQKIDNELESGQTFSQYAPDVRLKSLNGFLGLADVVARLIVNPKTGNRGAMLEGNNTVYAKNRLDERTIAPIEEVFEFGKHKPVAKKKEGNE